MTSQIQTGRGQRRAFTLMEVLISIGVAAIGILGVMTLLPLAQHHAFQGVLEDRKAIAGRVAFKDLRVMEFARAQRWLAHNGGGFQQVASTGAPQVGMSFCIDPMMLSNDIDPTILTLAGTPANVSRASTIGRTCSVVDPAVGTAATVKAFPNSGTGQYVMPRVTLSLMNGSTQGASLQMAEHLCRDYNDPEFDLGTDKTILPKQIDVLKDVRWKTNDVLGNPIAPVGAPSKRLAAGSYSWFATLVPQAGTDLNLYTVSVVVCYKRRTDYMIHPRAERTLNVVFLAPNEIQLTNPAAPEDFDLRPGQWIMLSVQPSQAGLGVIHKWYRVVQLEAEPQTAGTRSATIQGPDWQANWGTGNAGGGPNSVQATIVDGVVGVYEKLLRLESSSAWAP